MIPESVLYAAYVVLIGFGVAFCVALVAGSYIIFQAFRAFKDAQKGMKEFMQA